MFDFLCFLHHIIIIIIIIIIIRLQLEGCRAVALTPGLSEEGVVELLFKLARSGACALHVRVYD
jgi:hypothetical protein